MATALKLPQPEQALKQIGTRPIRPDGIEKVTGRAKFGADMILPGCLVATVLRSPHPHARILDIDTSKAEAVPGVKAIITAADFPEMPSKPVTISPYLVINFGDTVRNVIAHDKVLYQGHAVAAVAAISRSVARQALKLIEVDYEILPHVIDVMEAIKPDATILHENLITEGVEPAPTKASNVAMRVEFSIGDIEDGFNQADLVVERIFKTEPVHQAYIEPHACVAKIFEDGSALLFGCTQGHFEVREVCAKLLDLDQSKLRVTASEIGGGFGGKTVVYLEPLALALSRKSGHAIKMQMGREEVFEATGPAPGTRMRIKIGATSDGEITAGECELHYQAGAFPGGCSRQGAMTAFGSYALSNVKAVGYDIVSNRSKVAPYRAPGAPMSAFGVESVIDEIAKMLGIDPIEFRLRNAAREGTCAVYGQTFGPIGLIDTLMCAKSHDHFKAPLGPNQGRGVASGFWFNIGGATSAAITVNEDGTVTLIQGTPDIGGSRASSAMMAAEALGIDYQNVKAVVGNTDEIPFTLRTGGSRATHSNGVVVKAVVDQLIADMCGYIARLWDVHEDAVKWVDGHVLPATSNACDVPPFSLVEIAKSATLADVTFSSHKSIQVGGVGASFGTHIVDVEVDPETGRVTILRYTAIQDSGKAIHPAYVEGQIQGGVAQGIGWALSEEYIYGDDGKLQNPGFLDYRIPVAPDLPMIDAVIVECPDPNHPFGVRGVGETPIVPPPAAIANAIEQATGIRFTELPLSPPRILKAIMEHNRTKLAEGA